ncbi:MAG: tetratricopeptide repeat protein [Metallosphaera sp.]|uniref:tetratricopeptide repeat protein n=1 Tax=Metallosphaera sp. TaxID=2020860 RepID=UPI003161F1F7
MEVDESLEEVKQFIDQGNTYYTEGKYARAEIMYKKALEILKQHYEGHPDVVMVLKKLGLVYEDQGKHFDAENAYKQAQEILRKYSRSGSS